MFSVKNRAVKLTFLAFPGGPGGFREVREAGRNHFHLSWYLLVPGVSSYGHAAGEEKKQCMCTKPKDGRAAGALGHQLAVVAYTDGQLYCICTTS